MFTATVSTVTVRSLTQPRMTPNYILHLLNLVVTVHFLNLLFLDDFNNLAFSALE